MTATSAITASRYPLLIPVVILLCEGLFYILFSPAGLFLFSFTLLLWLLLFRVLPRKTFNFFLIFFLLSTGAKLLLFAYLHAEALKRGGYLVNYHDGYLYLSKAWSYVLYVKEGIDPFLNWHYLTKEYGDNSYTFFLFCWQYVFGQSFVSPYIINILLYFCIPFQSYFILLELSESEKTAKAGFFLFLFFPSLNYWSLDILRETFNIFSLLLLIYIPLIYAKKPVISSFLLLFAFSFLFFSVGAAKWLLLGFPLMWFFLFLSPGKRKAFLLTISSGIVISTFIAGMFFPQAVTSTLQKAENSLVQRQLRTAFIDGAGYYIYPETEAVGKEGIFAVLAYRPPHEAAYYAEAFIKGAVYFFFSPFPFSPSTENQLKALPQMALWYLLLPLFVYGVITVLKEKREKLYPALLFYLLYAPVLMMTCGNVGQLFRLRDILTPIFLLFAIIGIRQFLRRRQLL